MTCMDGLSGTFKISARSAQEVFGRARSPSWRCSTLS